MSADIDNLLTIYSVKLREFREGGYSEEQVKAFEKTVNLIQAASTVDEWKTAMEEQNVWFEISRAQTVDLYRTKQKIVEDTNYPMLAPLYKEAIPKMLAADNQEAINAIAEELDRKVDEAREIENRRRSSFYYCFTMVYRYHICGVIEYNYKMGFRERLAELGGLEELRKMVENDLYTTMFPFSEELYQELLENAKTLTKDEKAYTFTDEEQKLFERFIKMYPRVPEADEYMPDELQYMIDAAELCSDARNEMKVNRREREADKVVRVFSATAPKEEPGMYEFEKILEFDFMQQIHDEQFEDLWVQAAIKQHEGGDEKSNMRDKLAMMRRTGLF